ncbi:MAG: 2-hydroxyacyl-CoA dehydratase [Desulfobacteraceae bacterium]|nr:2-hydroxyacyl-CoA dehydratase [Desulfobacteraceae bacterium]
MMYEYFDNLEKGIKGRIDKEPQKIHARKKYVLEIARLGKRLYNQDENIAWCGVMAPFDLLNAMGVTSCFVEFVGAMLASTNTADHFLKQAEDEGYATDSCAYHRAVTGAVLENAMPEPNFIIGTSSPCTAGLAVMENFARAYKKDFFILNIPQNDFKEAISYLAGQIQEMTSFVAQHTGHPLSIEKIGKAIELTNKASLLLQNIYDLAKQKPSPVDNQFLKDFGTVMSLLLGTRQAVDICQAFKDELEHRINNPTPNMTNEKKRLLWIQNRIQYQFPINKMLDDLGAKIVVDELNDVTWEPLDPDNPFESIAKKTSSIPFCVDSTRRIDHIKQQIIDYKIDGVVHPCHWGCRQGTGIRGLVSKELRQMDIPVLNLEIDCVDSRNLAKGQIETRLEAFMEMMG